MKATFAPSLASRFTIAAPMPREPPVTRATLPEKSFVEVFMTNRVHSPGLAQ